MSHSTLLETADDNVWTLGIADMIAHRTAGAKWQWYICLPKFSDFKQLLTVGGKIQTKLVHILVYGIGPVQDTGLDASLTELIAIVSFVLLPH